jgi:hypothetical protein
MVRQTGNGLSDASEYGHQLQLQLTALRLKTGTLEHQNCTGISLGVVHLHKLMLRISFLAGPRSRRAMEWAGQLAISSVCSYICASSIQMLASD